MHSHELQELATARVALLRVPAAAAALAADRRVTECWPGAWCCATRACKALAAALRGDAAALSALAAAAFGAARGVATSTKERITAVKALGALIQASAVRALFPVSITLGGLEAPPWPPPPCLGFDSDDDAAHVLGVAGALGGLIQLAFDGCHDENLCSDEGLGCRDIAAAASDALVSLLAADAITALLSDAHMRALMAPLTRAHSDASVYNHKAADLSAAFCRTLAYAGAKGVDALCRCWDHTPGAPGNACALGCIALDVTSACHRISGSDAAAVLNRHVATLAAAARYETAVRCVVLPSGLPGALASAHARADAVVAPIIGSMLASIAWTPRGVAAVCELPGAADVAAITLTALATEQLAAASAAGDRLPGSAVWRDARYAASALGSHMRGRTALRSAGWKPTACASSSDDDGSESDDSACDDAPSDAVLSAALTAIEALLAEMAPGCLTALHRDGSAPAALLSRWLRREFRDEARWPDASGFVALASRDVTAALVAYPAALLLGPLRGCAARAVAALDDAPCGGGVLPGMLRAAARASGFTAAGAAVALRELEAHPAPQRFRAELPAAAS